MTKVNGNTKLNTVYNNWAKNIDLDWVDKYKEELGDYTVSDMVKEFKNLNKWSVEYWVEEAKRTGIYYKGIEKSCAINNSYELYDLLTTNYEVLETIFNMDTACRKPFFDILFQ